MTPWGSRPMGAVQSGTSGYPAVQSGVDLALRYASQATGVPYSLLVSVARTESGFNPRAVSPAGAIGLMQLMPSTARSLGVNPWDPVQNALGGARYLVEQFRRFGDWALALAAYNAGPGRVQQAIRRAGSRAWSAVARYLPRETQAYVVKVLRPFT